MDGLGILKIFSNPDDPVIPSVQPDRKPLPCLANTLDIFQWHQELPEGFCHLCCFHGRRAGGLWPCQLHLLDRGHAGTLQQLPATPFPTPTAE